MIRNRLLACCGVFALLSEPCWAADPPFFEATLLGGFRFGGKFTNATEDADRNLDSSALFGLTLNWRSNDTGYYELTYNRQKSTLQGVVPTDMTIEYLHIGGMVDFGYPEQRNVPYFLITAGGTRLTPDRADLGDETAFSLSIGGGLKVPIGGHFALRFETRAFATFFQAHAAVFCSSAANVCDIHVHGGSFLQAQGTVGVTARF